MQSRIVLALVALVAICLADREPRCPSVSFRSHSGPAISNAELPDRVVAPDGEVTLLVDFENAEQEGVPVYLVNRSARVRSYSSIGGSINCRLQRRMDDAWEAAQSGPGSVECADSYYTVHLPTGCHFRFLGYQAREGDRQEVRYVIDDLESNTGEGLVDERDVTWARELPDWTRHLVDPWPKHDEVEDIELAVGVVVLFSSYLDSEMIRYWARWNCDQWKAEDNPIPFEARNEAIIVVGELLEKDWPAKKKPVELADRCRRALSNEDKGMGGIRPVLAWKVLDWLLGEDSDYEGKRALCGWCVETALRRIPGLDQREERELGILLGTAPQVNEFLTLDDCEDLLRSGQHWVRYAAVRRLAEREEWERLLKAGLEVPPKDRGEILGAVVRGVHDRRGQPQFKSSFEKFFLSTLEEAPGVVGDAIARCISLRDAGSGSPYIRGSAVDRAFRYPMSSFLREEARRARERGCDFEVDDVMRTDKIVQLIDLGWDGRTTTIFSDLLDHGGYHIADLGDGRRKKIYGVRRAARDALRSRGVVVDPDLVVEVEIEHASDAPESR